MPSSNSKKYQHVIFDFDGVICDSLAQAMKFFNEIREQRFPSLPHVKSKGDMAIVYSGPLKTSLTKWLTQEETREFFDLHSAAMARVAPSLNTFPGIVSVLAGLGPGRASIVTSAYSDAVRRILAGDSDFDASCLFKIAGRELRQPKTKKIHDILSELRLVPEGAVYVGDLESDILYCRDVPMDIIAVGYGYHPASYIATKGPTYLAETVEELGETLQQLT